MEPLRTCQSAKQFAPTAGPPAEDGSPKEYLGPCATYPNCAYCPMQLSTLPPPDPAAGCAHCGARRMSLYDVPADMLLVPDVAPADFEHVVSKARKTVAEEELEQFEKWTEEFGQEG